jgi:DnaJ domain
MLYLHWQRVPGIPDAPNVKLRSDIYILTFSGHASFSNTSVHSNGISPINFDVLQEFLVFVKQIPTNDRSYEPTQKTWMVKDRHFEALKTIAETFPKFKNNIELVKWDNLAIFLADSDPKQISYLQHKQWSYYVNNGTPGFNKNWQGVYGTNGRSEPQIKEEDFFYSAAQPIAQSQFKASVEEVLVILFGVSVLPSSKEELTRLYRKAALKYHPDRNAGDSSKMSELNVAWQQFKIEKGV